MSDAGLGASIGLIGGPVGAGIGALIGSQFGNPDPTSFTQTNKGASTAPGQIAYQGISPSQDSATQFFRSLTNKDALDGSVSQTKGIGGVDDSSHHLQKVLDYYTSLLGGNRDEVSSAIGPEADQIGTQFDNIRKMVSQGGSRGGGSASTLSTLNQQQTAQITDLINKSRRGAASGLQSAAGQEANTGFNQQTLGQAQQDRALQAELAKLGINLGERGQNMKLAGELGSSLGSSAITALI